MENNNNGSNSGIGFLGLLTILFIGLKLTNFVTWTWVWVLSPIWLPIAIPLGIVLVGAVIVLIKKLVEIITENINKKKDEK